MIDHLKQENVARVTRRQLFGKAACGVGAAALATLLNNQSASADDQDKKRFGGLPGLPHFAPKAKRVIVFWQGGGPSHVDLFDPKPKLKELEGQNVPDSIRGFDPFVNDVVELQKVAMCSIDKTIQKVWRMCDGTK